MKTASIHYVWCNIWPHGGAVCILISVTDFLFDVWLLLYLYINITQTLYAWCVCFTVSPAGLRCFEWCLWFSACPSAALRWSGRSWGRPGSPAALWRHNTDRKWPVWRFSAVKSWTAATLTFCIELELAERRSSADVGSESGGCVGGDWWCQQVECLQRNTVYSNLTHV